jgi:hypothetical protein
MPRLRAADGRERYRPVEAREAAAARDRQPEQIEVDELPSARFSRRG